MIGRFDVDLVPEGKRTALVHRGQVLRRVPHSWGAYYARLEERRLRIEAAVQRPCMCCGGTFQSEGPQNRLCNDCRRLSDG